MRSFAFDDIIMFLENWIGVVVITLTNSFSVPAYQGTFPKKIKKTLPFRI